VRRSLCGGFVTILCGLCAVVPAHAAKRHAHQSAKRPTVTSELQRLAAAGAVAPADYDADLSAYKDARAKAKRLNGARRLELGGVIRDLEDMAARRQLTASRLPSLFLTLRTNTQWWSTSPLLAANQRVELPGSELVWQHYAGHGIQIQWLGTFGKLNALWRAGRRNNARVGLLLDEALALAAQRAGGIAWEYLFAFDGQRPPWVSSLAQGTGLQALARSATRLGRTDAFPALHAGLAIFQASPPEGVGVPEGAGAHYLQYSGLPRLHILNGFIQSLVGLYDYAQLTGDPVGQSLFAAGDAAARAEVPTFDTGAWSLYSRGSSQFESGLGYHTLLRDFLAQLCSRTAAIEYCGAADHFTAYLTVPPAVQVLGGVLRAGRTGHLRFTITKVSRVSVTVARGAKTVTTLNLGTVGHGTRSLDWKPPKRAGEYTVTVTATDLAGNPGGATGSVEVLPRK